MNTAPSEEQIILIRDILSSFDSIRNQRDTTSVHGLKNNEIWLDLGYFVGRYKNHFEIIFTDVRAEIPLITQFFITLQSHNYESIPKLAGDPQFSKLLYEGRDSNYANIMLLITNHLIKYRTLLNNIEELIQNIQNHSSDDDLSTYNLYFQKIVKKMNKVKRMMDGDEFKQDDIITRFGTSSFFTGGVIQEIPPFFVRVVRFFKNLF
jgi:hypothetical protein